MLIRAATWDDLEATADLLAARSRTAAGLGGVRVAQLRAEWERPGFAHGRDNVVVEQQGATSGYAALRPSGELVLAASDDETADALLDAIVDRARERGDTMLSIVVRSSEPPLDGLVRRRRFVLDGETLLMWRPLGGEVEAPRIPEGVEIRTYEDSDARAVHGLLDEAYTWDENYAPMAHDVWERWMTGDPEFDASVWWLAERGSELIGCALHWTSGWLKDLAVVSSERGRGVGTALVEQGLFEFAEVGMPRVGLKVDAANPTGAVQLYERAGFVTSSHEAAWRLAL